MLGVEVLKPFSRDVRVDGRRRNVRVAKQQLDDTKIGAMVQEVRRKRMAQHVWREARRGNSRCHRVTLD